MGDQAVNHSGELNSKLKTPRTQKCKSGRRKMNGFLIGTAAGCLLGLNLNQVYYYSLRKYVLEPASSAWKENGLSAAFGTAIDGSRSVYEEITGYSREEKPHPLDPKDFRRIQDQEMFGDKPKTGEGIFEGKRA